MATVLLESRSYRPFKSSEEYLYAMREDLAEWLNTMYPEILINVDNFMDRLDTGVALCKHANNVRQAAEEYLARRHARNKSMTRSMTSGLAGPILAMGNVHYLQSAKIGTFFARDNVSNFISWCRKSLQIFECLLFETDDLIMRKNEKHVILCLLEVARRGAKFGMLAPTLVQMERQIDREIAADNKANGVCDNKNDNGNMIASCQDDLYDSDSEDECENEEPMLMYGPQQQIVTNDLKSLDEMVRDLVEKCTCPSQFPMIRVSEGKYRIGDTKVLIFVRILRSHVMVRVGGGWDTLSHYLDKHDPCRCRAQHRSSVAAKLVTKMNNATNGIELHKAQVVYERSPPAVRKITQQSHQSPLLTLNNGGALSPPSATATSMRSRSKSPAVQQRKENTNGQHQVKTVLFSPNVSRRSLSPSPRRIADMKKKSLTPDPATNDEQQSPKHQQQQHLNNQHTHDKAQPPSSAIATTGIATTDVVNNSENISDNGSEISDEGYRSLGVIQNNGNNNTSNNNSNHSNAQVSTQDSDDNIDGCLEFPIETEHKNDSIISNGLEMTSEQNEFEKSGINITDDEITVDISSATGLKKTNFSSELYTEDFPVKKATISKIPQSPCLGRRRSVEPIETSPSPNCCNNNSKSNTLSRNIPVYRSVRKPAVSNIQQTKENTWSGRSTKKRTPISAATFDRPHAKPNQRNSTPVTGSYDKNGRRIKCSSSMDTSPIKTPVTSPLAQQLLDAAGKAKNDAQILEKMKELLSIYSKKDSYDDFTTAWVNNNGNLDRSADESSKMLSKRSSTVSSSESCNSKDIPSIASPRKASGISKIPAPVVRSNTELY